MTWTQETRSFHGFRKLHYLDGDHPKEVRFLEAATEAWQADPETAGAERFGEALGTYIGQELDKQIQRALARRAKTEADANANAEAVRAKATAESKAKTKLDAEHRVKTADRLLPHDTPPKEPDPWEGYGEPYPFEPPVHSEDILPEPTVPRDTPLKLRLD